MVEQDSHIDTADGQMDIFVAYPHEDRRFPVVLFYMDAPGIREELRGMARRIAAEGYFVVLPNLYYRDVQAASAEYAAMPADKRIACARNINNRLVMQDTGAMLGYVETHACADESLVGAVGFCMSGAFVLAAAGTYPARIKCAASVYGVNLVTEAEDSPHLRADRVVGELYFACAEHDDYVPDEVIDKLEARLNETATTYRLDWYPGTRHGFAFPEREGAYDHTSAERVWDRLFDLFARNLQAPAA